MPVISIIIPIYNAEKYLCKCIESVIAQTYKDWEAILVNDGSKDGSLAICKEYADMDERIRVIDKENGGVSSARNKGLAVARGEWITFMDSDDWLDDDAFQVYIEAAQRTGVAIVKTGYRRAYNHNDNPNPNLNTNYNKEEQSWDEITLMDKSDTLAMLQEMGYFTFVWNMLVSAKIAKFLRFDEATPWLEDQFFGYECLLKTEKTTILSKIVYNYRTHESGSLSGVSDPFVIAYSSKKDMEYKQMILGTKHTDVLRKCWKTYHQWQAQAIDSLYRNGYSYSERKRYLLHYAPIDGQCVYAEERKFFEDNLPFCLRDAIEVIKRKVKNI